MKTVRCAIYTRKSSEEGLGQEFSSLDAQREACASYIASQKHEGWVLVPQHYDDGGISGGTLVRAGLQRLLKEIDDGLIDQIVVYKIDRLTRSLADFAKLVERLDKANASFVSVTQSFNTATSMGRLTLNVLLSFAQFEREVTAERIRDKIAASKRKGLWMGGPVPLGYEPDGRSLRIVSDEAETVRRLFDLYLELGSIYEVKRAADRLGLQTKSRARKAIRTITNGNAGKASGVDADRVAAESNEDQEDNDPKLSIGGSASFGVSNIHYVLTNPIYAGRIRHREQVHDGNHPAIIDPAVWDKVQQMLSASSARERGRPGHGAKISPLAGKLFDEVGDHLTPTHANNRRSRYRYYVSNRLISGKGADISTMDRGWRLPAPVLESQLASATVRHLTDRLPGGISPAASTDDLQRVQHRLGELASSASAEQIRATLNCIKQATISPGKVDLVLCDQATGALLGTRPDWINPDALTFPTGFQYRKRGVETKLIIGAGPAKTRDDVLIRNIAKAQSYYDAIKQGGTFEDIAKSDGISTRRVMQISDLAFLAPAIVQMILSGDQPTGLTTKWLAKNALPSDWQKQRKIIATL